MENFLEIMGKTIVEGENGLWTYFKEINEFKLLDKEEEIDLAEKRNRGDAEALEKLTLANLRFVVSIAKQYQNKGLPLEDLINEGNLGLMKAAKRFDETRGFKFISYAVWWIRQSISQALGDNGRMVRLPSNIVVKNNKIKRAARLLEQQLEREPSTEEIAEVMEISVLEVNDILQRGEKHLSLQAPLQEGEEEGDAFLDVIENDECELPDDNMKAGDLIEELELAFTETLSPRETEILRLYFGLNGEDPLILEEIGTKLNLSSERTRRIKEKALQKLRRSSRTRLLMEFL